MKELSREDVLIEMVKKVMEGKLTIRDVPLDYQDDVCIKLLEQDMIDVKNSQE